MKKKIRSPDPMIVNKKARFNYDILDEIEAGIVLQGSEVKSVRDKKVNLDGSFATIKSGEIFLTNLRIEPYKNSLHFNHEPTRPRKLLLKKKEVNRLLGKIKEKGVVVVPLKIYFKHQWLKVLLGLGKGKKMYDKRRILKEKDIQQDMKRELRKRW